jgi:serine phosphatase RsbU (regulator of sigma subunit)
MFRPPRHIHIIMLLFLSGPLFGQLTPGDLRAIDSLKLIADSDAPDSVRLNALIEWDNLIYQYDPELDIELNERIINIANEGLQRANLTTREKDHYLSSKGSARNNLGLVLIDYGNYLDALKSMQESLEIAEYFRDSTRLGNALNNIGMIYDHMSMPEKALEYYDSSISYTNHDAYSYSTYYNNAGLCYYRLEDYEMALDCYEKSLVYADSAADYVGMGNTYSNMGLVYINKEEYKLAIDLFNKAISIYREHTAERDGMSQAVTNIGVCYFELGQVEKSIDYCKEGLELANQYKSLQMQKESCRCLYKGYKKSGNTALALKFHEDYLFYRDSLESMQKNSELLRIDFQFNYARQHMQDSIAQAAEYAVRDEMQQLQFDADIAREEKMQYILFLGIGVALMLGGISYRSYRLKKKDNEIIARQKEEVESQKELVEEKNKEITDSINYARRIQEAILPNRDLFSKYLPESFILYKPKDIVAGDFYWLEESDGKVIFAVADCTGHGVPGAMVSVVCHNALNRSVKEFGLIDPGKILDKTRELVIETFEKGELKNLGQKSDVIRDGMDIALCVLDPKTNTLNFAGANNGLYHLAGNSINEIIPDKQPIGKYAEEKSFRTQNVRLSKGDQVYLYSDGYADQFGGPEGKKFKYKQLKELLEKNAHLTAGQQYSLLDATFEEWKGSLEQVDDVCLMGIRI